MPFTLKVYLDLFENGKLIAREIETDDMFETREEAEAKKEEILKKGYKNYTKDEVRHVLINPKQ